MLSANAGTGKALVSLEFILSSVQAQGLTQILFPMARVFPTSCRKNTGYSLQESAERAVHYWSQNAGPQGEGWRLINEVAVMIFEIFAKQPGNVFF